MSELDVYSRLVAHLEDRSIRIVCASPPAGTDPRFPRCYLPRPDATQRANRDEVDVTAVIERTCVLIECKAAVSHSLSKLNTAGESDLAKLRRLGSTWTATELIGVFRRAHGVEIDIDTIVPALAVETVDMPCPDMIVIHVDGASVGLVPGLLADRAIVDAFS